MGAAGSQAGRPRLAHRVCVSRKLEREAAKAGIRQPQTGCRQHAPASSSLLSSQAFPSPVTLIAVQPWRGTWAFLLPKCRQSSDSRGGHREGDIGATGRCLLARASTLLFSFSCCPIIRVDSVLSSVRTHLLLGKDTSYSLLLIVLAVTVSTTCLLHAEAPGEAGGAQGGQRGSRPRPAVEGQAHRGLTACHWHVSAGSDLISSAFGVSVRRLGATLHV